MIEISEAYEQCLNETIRNRMNLVVEIDATNKAAESSLKLDKYSKFMSPTDKFDSVMVGINAQNTSVMYATFEENVFRADGKQRFIASDPTWQKAQYLCSQRMSNELTGNGLERSINFTFNNLELHEITGMTINFGDRHPIAFSMEWSVSRYGENTAYRKTFKNVDSPLFYVSASDMLHDQDDTAIINYIKIYAPTYADASSSNRRLRIHGIILGSQITFDNSDIISAKYDSQASPISAELPYKSFSVQLSNYNGRFNDAYNSELSALSIGQEVKVSLGIDTGDGNYDYIRLATLSLSSWNMDTSTFTINAKDRISNFTDAYRNYSLERREFQSDIQAIMNKHNLVENTDYTLEVNGGFPTIGQIANPIIDVGEAETLQLISNAMGLVMYEDNMGIIRIRYIDLLNTELIIHKIRLFDMLSNPIVIQEQRLRKHKVYRSAYEAPLEPGYAPQKVSEDFIEHDYSDNGMLAEYNNPLTDQLNYMLLNASVTAYHSNNLEYDISYRGFPQIEVFDKLYLDSRARENIPVIVTKHSLTFNGALKGSMTVRRIG